ncbi:MAG: ABC transporter substrate binding protein, partial [Desulfarculaceae bacterium]
MASVAKEYTAAPNNSRAERPPVKLPSIKKRLSAGLLSLWFAAVSLFVYTLHNPSFVWAKSASKILAVHSYHPGNTWQRSVDSSLDKELKKSGLQLEVYHEYIDSLRITHPSQQVYFFNYLKNKYQKTGFDVVVATDNEALYFLLNYRDWLFQKLPVVFSGINDYRPEMLRGQELYTGVAENIDIHETLTVISSLFPETNKVVIYGSRTMTHYANLDLIQRVIRIGNLPYKTDVFDQKRIKEVLASAGKLKRGSVILVISPVQDEVGQLMPLTVSTRMISKASKVPIFSFWDYLLGHGIIGGKLVNGTAQGEAAAQLCVRILKGERIKDLPVVTKSPNRYMFDYLQLKQFKLPLDILPAGATIINEPQSIFLQYRRAILIVTAIFLVLCVIIIVLMGNIWKRKNIESQLRESEEKFRKFSDEASIDGIIVHSNGKILDVSEPFAAMFRYKREELIGMDALETIAPEQREVVKEYIQQRYEKNYESCGLRKDGSKFPIEIRARNLWFQGKVVRTAAVRDISERKQSEERLLKAQSLLMAAIEQSSAGIVIADAPDGTIRIANSAALGIRGQSKLPLTDIPFDRHHQNWQIFNADGSPCKPEEMPLTRAITKGETFQDAELIMRRSDGEDRWVTTNAAPVRNEQGEIISGVAVFVDITERKRGEQEKRTLEAQLRQSQKMEAVGTLAGGIAHDFNNILQAISGYVQLMTLTKNKERFNSGFLAEIDKAAERASELIQNLLTFSRKVEPELRPVNLNHEVVQAAKILERTLPKMIAIETHLAEDLKTVNADANQLSQVFLNMGTNAMDAMPEGGRLTIKTKNRYLDYDYCRKNMGIKPGHYVELEFSDNGHGMDLDTQKSIFDPFFTTKEIGKG